jgi:hypothetical protein
MNPDWYEIDCLIATGAYPLDAVAWENKWGGSAQTLLPVASTIRTGERMDHVSESIACSAADRIDGAA